MTRVSAIALLLAACCAGCGGNNLSETLSNLGIHNQSGNGGNSGTIGDYSNPYVPGSPLATVSPYLGQFVGTWSAASTGCSGTADFVVASSGSLTGTLHDNRSGATQSISGTISSVGYIAASSTPPGLSLAGSMTLAATGQMTGSLTEETAESSAIESFVLTKQ